MFQYEAIRAKSAALESGTLSTALRLESGTCLPMDPRVTIMLYRCRCLQSHTTLNTNSHRRSAVRLRNQHQRLAMIGIHYTSAEPPLSTC